MKFSTQKENLENKLMLASRFCLLGISSIPSLSGGLLSLSKSKLEITTTNLNDFFNTFIKVESESEGSGIVDIKKIVEFLNFLPQGKIDVELKDNKLTLKHKKTKGIFNVIDPTDFPSPPKRGEKKYNFKKTFLKKNLPLVIFSAATDNSRPILTGINFVYRNDELSIVSTDGFRLSLIRLESKQKAPTAIISANLLNEVLKLIDGEDEIEIAISENEKTIFFNLGDISIFSRLIDGEFPPFEKVLPTSYTTKIVLDREELIKNIKLASIFARDFSSVVIFEIKESGLYIKPRTKQEEGTTIFQDIEIEGDEKMIAFNFKFLLDFLNNIKDDKIIFEMTQSNAPAVFKSEKNNDFTHIIMPIRTEEDAT